MDHLMTDGSVSCMLPFSLEVHINQGMITCVLYMGQHAYVCCSEMELKCAYSFCTRTFRTEKGRNAHYKSADGKFHNRDFTSSRKRKLSEYDASSDVLREEINSMSGAENSDWVPVGDPEVEDNYDFLAGGALTLDTAYEDPGISNVSAASIFIEKYHGAAETMGIGPNMYTQRLEADEHSESRRIAGPWYPFAGKMDWELAKWLNSSHLSVDKIDEFLRLDLVSSTSN